MSEKVTTLADIFGKTLLQEVRGISFEVRAWANIIQSVVDSEYKKYWDDYQSRLPKFNYSSYYNKQGMNSRQHYNYNDYDEYDYYPQYRQPQKQLTVRDITNMNQKQIDDIIKKIMEYHKLSYDEVMVLSTTETIDLYNQIPNIDLLNEAEETTISGDPIPKPTEIIINGPDYPEAFANFSVDKWIIADKHPTEYDHVNSGYQENGEYVVFINCQMSNISSYVLIHEIKHAYQDWHRASKNKPPIRDSKVLKQLYTKDFEKFILSHQGGYHLKSLDSVISAYYMSTDVEITAYLEGTYDEIFSNATQPAGKLRDLGKNMAKFKAEDVANEMRDRVFGGSDPEKTLQKRWEKIITEYDIPFFRKFKDVFEFLKYTEKFFNKKGKYIINKVDKLKTFNPETLQENVNSEKKTIVKPSTGKGNGLFAATDINRGDTVLEATVIIMSDEDWEKIKDTEPVRLFGFQWGNEVGIPLGEWKFEFKNNKEKRAWKRTEFYKKYCPDGLKFSGFLYVNDVDENNKANVIEYFDVENNLIGIIATRDINSGEEIIKKYNYDWRTEFKDWREHNLNEGLMLPYKKFPDKYFDLKTREEFPKSEINKHPLWYKRAYDNNGNKIYYERSNGEWTKWERDNNENVIYREDSDGYWVKREYDIYGNQIYYEDSNGYIEDNREHIQEGLSIPYKDLSTPEKWFKDLLNQMDTYDKSQQYPNSIFFYINKEIYMEYYKNFKTLYYHYDKIYSVLISKFGLKYDQINKLVKGMVEEHYKLEVDIAKIRSSSMFARGGGIL